MMRKATQERRSLSEIATDSLLTGVISTATTTAAAAALGRQETGSMSAPINAVSHIVWGDRAARQSKPSAKHTLTGLILNAGAVACWAAVQELVFGRRKRRPSVSEALMEGAAVTGLAYITDYHVVPDRLTPGFEKRLSNKALFGIYGVLALSLAAGALLRRR